MMVIVPARLAQSVEHETLTQLTVTEASQGRGFEPHIGRFKG